MEPLEKQRFAIHILDQNLRDTLSTIGSDRTDTKIQLKNGQEIKVILWDTAGEERFRSMALKALKAVQGIVLVFDVIKKIIVRECFKLAPTNKRQFIKSKNSTICK